MSDHEKSHKTNSSTDPQHERSVQPPEVPQRRSSHPADDMPPVQPGLFSPLSEEEYDQLVTEDLEEDAELNPVGTEVIVSEPDVDRDLYGGDPEPPTGLLNIDLSQIQRVEMTDEQRVQAVRAAREDIDDMYNRMPELPAQRTASTYGASISVGARAAALEAIMAYFSKDNKTRGSGVQHEISGSDFNRRYAEDAADVQRGAERNRDILAGRHNRAINTLMAGEALRAAGFDENEIELERSGLQAGLRQRYGGTGEEAVKNRRRLLKSIHRSADTRS